MERPDLEIFVAKKWGYATERELARYALALEAERDQARADAERLAEALELIASGELFDTDDNLPVKTLAAYRKATQPKRPQGRR